MATNTAPTTWPATTPPLRQLWQVPACLLGLTALIGLLIARPFWLTSERAARRQLAEARRLLERPDGDTARAASLAQSYLDRAGPNAAQAGEAHFLAGSALVKAARAASGKEAGRKWRAARRHFEEAEQHGVSAEDETLLRFRLGLAGSYTEMAPARVVELLSGSVAAANDKVEGYRRLTLAYLQLPKPDLEAALKANEELRQLPLLGEEVLGPARVLGGELLLRLGRPGEARKVLRQAAPEDAPAVLARARALRARSHQDEGQWEEAAALWQAALNDKRQPPEDPATILYQLGLCQFRLEQPGDAAAAWEKCVRAGKPEPAQAASLGLAEVRLGAANLPGALEAFEASLKNIKHPQDWKNRFVALKKAQEVFERGCKLTRERGDFERSVKLAILYERLGPPGQAALLAGQAATGWGQAIRERATRSGSAEAARQALGQSVALYRQAGAAYARASGQAELARERSRRLWLAADCYLKGDDPAAAIPALRQFLDLGQHPELLGEGWYLLGEASQAVGKAPEAEAAWHESLKHQTRFAFRSWYRLSQAELQRKPPQVDRAKEILEQNVRQLRLTPDAEALENSLYALGGLLFRQHKYQTAVAHLEEAVTKFPSSPRAMRGRFELAECYRNLATLQNLNDVVGRGNPKARAHYERQHREWLRRAAQQYAELSKTLPAPKDSALNSQEQVHVLFSAAECRFNLGDYSVALDLYGRLANRFKGRPERLTALGGLVRCRAALEVQARKAQRAAEAQEHATRLTEGLQAIRAGLTGLDADTRRQWEEWLKVAGKPL
jgi:tetratricopeptide (TPR) repeat protein